MCDKSIFDYKRALNPKGVFVMVGGSIALALQLLFLGSWISRKERKRLGILMHKPNTSDLDFLSKLFEEGKVKPFTDKCYTLSEVPEAFRYYGEGHTKGKIVITV